jgi:hypothetical protein
MMRFSAAISSLFLWLAVAGWGCAENTSGGPGGFYSGGSGGGTSGDAGSGAASGGSGGPGGDIDGGPGEGGDGGDDPGRDGGDRPSTDGGEPRPNPDAFFADDPPPEQCFPDGGRGDPPDPPGGTPECPDDKNREGCPCGKEGEEAPCWPGLRANRNRGICKDGVTRCEYWDEFYNVWGPCEGYVLPMPGATLGANACKCFSMGQWALDNLSPCFVTYSGGAVYGVSTYIKPDGNADCPTAQSNTPPPSPQPGQPWTTNRLTVDCAGQFELCYTLKAGDVEDPQATDCTVARVCVQAWYEKADEEQELPTLPAWTSTDPACSRNFNDNGGYGEMSVLGLSEDCEEIDDGSGGHYVFNRVGYCPMDCADRPNDPDCIDCVQGGSGTF